ncbi:MAG: ABC transporter substrate-binding protein [Acidimicrobiales bacterium]
MGLAATAAKLGTAGVSVGAAAATTLGGCVNRRQARIEMAVGWGGVELDMLRAVLRGYDHEVEVTPVGDDIDAFLRTRHRAGNLPDLAVVPRPGLVRAYARRGWIRRLDPLASRYPRVWNELVEVDGGLYGVWARASHKSLFWHLPSVFDGPVPSTWAELVELVRQLAADDGPAPLAVGAADGWVLTDWFENLLASRATPGLYDTLARGGPQWHHRDVRAALADLAEIWSIPGAFPGGGQQALLTGYDQSVVQVASTREAVLLYEGDFVASTAAPFLDDEGFAYFRFPSPTAELPLVVGGDVAVVADGSDAGLELADWLSGGDDAFRVWREAGDYLSPNLDVPVGRYPAGRSRSLAQEILDQEQTLRFDLSDLLPGELNGADGVGSWQVLQDFFAHVAVRRPDVDAAIDEAVGSLNEMARRVTREATTEGPA